MGGASALLRPEDINGKLAQAGSMKTKIASDPVSILFPHEINSFGVCCIYTASLTSSTRQRRTCLAASAQAA